MLGVMVHVSACWHYVHEIHKIAAPHLRNAAFRTHLFQAQKGFGDRRACPGSRASSPAVYQSGYVAEELDGDPPFDSKAGKQSCRSRKCLAL